MNERKPHRWRHRIFSRREDTASTSTEMAIFTLLNTAFNFFRSIIIAASYGAGALSDAYYSTVAFLYTPAGALMDSMTMLVQPRSQAYRREGREPEYLASYLSVTAIAFTALSFSFLALSPVIAPVIFKGLPVESIGIVNRLVLYSLPAIAISPLFVIVDYALRGDRFFIYGNIGVVMNSAIAALTLFFFASAGIEVIALSTLAGYLANAGIIGYAAFRKKILPGTVNLTLGFREAKKSLPLFAGSLAGIGAGYIEKYIASFLPSGTITMLSMSTALIWTAQGLLVGTFISVYYPFISDAIHSGDVVRFDTLVLESKRMTFGIFGLGIVSMAAFAHPVFPLIFGYGKFGRADAAVLASIFTAGTFTLLQASLTKIAEYAFYAKGDTRIPVTINLGGFVLLGVILKIAAAPRLGAWGITAAGSIAGFAGMIAAAAALQKTQGLKLLTPRDAMLALCILGISLAVSSLPWSPFMATLPVAYYFLVSRGIYGLGPSSIIGAFRGRRGNAEDRQR